MIIYVLKRLASIGIILVIMSILIFGITQALPGSVAHIIAGQFAPDEVVQAIAEKLGLNDPLPVQYWRWASGILTGDLGDSLIMERPIAPMLSEALGRSAILAVASFFFIAVVGIGLGVIAAIHHNKPVDHAVSTFTYLGISVPEFFWGLVLILIFSRYLRWFPTGGYTPLDEGFGPWLWHLVLPTATLTFAFIAHISRLTRSSMLETLRSQYVKNARAKGMPERVVIVRHALRNALLPTITVLAIDVGVLIGGIVVIENVFSYPGLGRLLIFAIERHDLPLVQAAILIVAAIYCISNLMADLLYAYLNPRIRSSESGR